MQTIASSRVLFSLGRIALLAGVAFAASLGTGHSQGAPATSEAVAIATNAYIYGYPLVTMEITRRVATNIDVPNETGHAPMGQFSHMRKYPDASFRDVTAPNADTL